MDKPRITLTTLPQATAQEVFDQVKHHLLSQKAKSKNSEGCAYRGDGGLMCAAGCLISDKEYAPYMDNGVDGSWRSLVNKGVFPKEHMELVQKLQTIHDGFPEKDWIVVLKQLAESLNLTY